jgi:hypothetical protein
MQIVVRRPIHKLFMWASFSRCVVCIGGPESILIFLDSSSSVLPNPETNPVVEIARCRQLRKFAVLHTSAVVIFSGDAQPRQLARFDVATVDPSTGLFFRAAWTSSS